MTSPSQEDAYSALHRPLGKAATPETIARVSAELDEANPLMALSREAFISLLGLTVACNVAVHGRTKTRTAIQLRQGLEVLHGTRDVSSFDLDPKALWTWDGLAGLRLEPVVAFAYMRMVRELRAMQSTVEA